MKATSARLLLCACLSGVSLLAEMPVMPPEAVPVLPATPLVPTKPEEDEGTITMAEAADGTIKTAWRLASPGKLAKSYHLGLSRTFTQPIAAGQVCVFTIKARTVEAATPDAKGLVSVAVQNVQPNEKSPLWKEWTIGKEWDTTFFVFQADHDLPEGAGIVKVNAGEARQILDIADFQLYRFPVGFDVFKAPQMKRTYTGREADAPWRKEAAERIGKLRRGTLTVRVVDADGKPVPGAKVAVRMQRHRFGFGSAVNPVVLAGLSDVPSSDQQKYRDIVDEFCSRIVPEHGMRVGNIDAEDRPDKPWEARGRRRNAATVPWMMQWAQDHKISVRGHYLVWCYVEPWAREVLDKDGVAGLLRMYDRHIKFSLPLYAPYVEEWDALNHPVTFVEADALDHIIGPDFYSDIYRQIRAQTDKLLFVNEDTFNAERADRLEKHVRHMIELGTTPDGCGFQSHFSDHSIPGMQEQWALFQRFGALVKHLSVTEYDLQSLDDELHADHLRDMLTLTFSHPQMTGFVMWGFWEKQHWRPTAALFRADWSERPAVKVWRDLVLGQWWTKADHTSDTQGAAAAPAFYGWHSITVEHQGRMAAATFDHKINGSVATVKLPR
ncbi:MAG: endo-1,4-beta-xylanase [Prosthecobacter sp.]